MAHDLMPEIAALPAGDLRAFVLGRAEQIVRATPGSAPSWDDAEEWAMSAAELAHAVVRLLGGTQ